MPRYPAAVDDVGEGGGFCGALMAHLLANNDGKRQLSTIKGKGYLVVFIAVDCCELLLVISFY